MNPQPPNILFILMDDLGWRDLSCYGSMFYETPNLDRLAAQGMRFTDAYAACPVCSPTRASILTGKYPATIGLTDWIDNAGHIHPCRGRLIDAPYIKRLPLAETTIATALRAQGYRTWHVGKWHLGERDTWPDHHGFDINIAGCARGSPKTYFSPWDIPTLADGPPGQYLTDRLTDEAIALIQRKDDRPFFLNFCHYAVHTPIEAPQPLIDKYTAKARAMGLDKVEAIIPGEHFPTEHKRHLRIQRRVIQSDPVYAAMIENLDTNIGRLLAALDETHQADNTIVIFTSDNGGLATSEGSPTSNRPLCEGKGWMYEGGTREPLIVRYPPLIQPNSICNTPVTSPDFYPTLLELAGLTVANEEARLDGISLTPLLTGQGQLSRDAIFWHYPHYGNQGGTPGSSVRRGDWKLIEFFEDGRLELYNLRDDIGEQNNLATTDPARAQRLHMLLDDWRKRVNALAPSPNPSWTGGK